MTPRGPSADREAGREHFPRGSQVQILPLPHDADVGLQGVGAAPVRAFEQATRVLTAVVRHAEVEPNLAVEVRCEAPDLELLFVEWLNAVIYERALRRMLFGSFAVTIEDRRRNYVTSRRRLSSPAPVQQIGRRPPK